MDHCTCESRKALESLKTARGQIDGIVKMIEDDRYCIDVSKQILSVIALLKKANHTILRQHMGTCVADAIKSGDAAEKMTEIMQVIERYVE